MSLKLLRICQVADRLNCSKSHAYRLLDLGVLPKVKVGVKAGYRVPADAVDRYVKDQIEKFLTENA